MLSFLLIHGGALATDDLRVSLDDAYQNDPQWRAAVYAFEGAQEKGPQARAELLPTIEINGSKNYNRSRYDSINGLAHFEPRFYKFQSYYAQARLVQPLFNWDKLTGYRQSDFDLLAASELFRKDKQDFLLRVVKAYFDVAAAIEGLNAASMQVASLKERQEISSRSYKIGTGNITEVAETEARLELGKGQEISAKRDLNSARASFRAIVGRPDRGVRLLNDSVEIATPMPANEEQWNTNASANYPDVLRKRALYEKAVLEIEKQRSGHYPTIDAVLSRDWSGSEHTTTTLEGFYQGRTVAGVEVSIPIFSGFSVTSLVREAAANKSKSFEDLEYARRTAIADSSDAYSKVTEGLNELTTYRRAMEISLKSLEANRLGYKVGIRSNIDVLNSEQQVYSTALRIIKAKYDALYYSQKLKAMAGELLEPDILEVNKLLY